MILRAQINSAGYPDHEFPDLYLNRLIFNTFSSLFAKWQMPSCLIGGILHHKLKEI